MDDNRIARLTEAQRQCLRLVMVHKGSKEIARELGISPHTVDQRLRVAIHTLGVTRRSEAALILAAHEGVYQPPAYQAPSIDEAEIVDKPPPHDRQPLEPSSQDPAEPAPRSVWTDITNRVLAGIEPRKNDLTARQRIARIAVVATLAAFAFGMLLSGLDGLSRLI